MPCAFIFVEPSGSEFVFIVILEAAKSLAEQPPISKAIFKYLGQEPIDFNQPILKICSFQRKNLTWQMSGVGGMVIPIKLIVL